MNQAMNRRKLTGVVIVLSMLFATSVFAVGTWQSINETLEAEEDLLITLKGVSAGCFIENSGQLPDSDTLFYGALGLGFITFQESLVVFLSRQGEIQLRLQFESSAPTIPEGLDPSKCATFCVLDGLNASTEVWSCSALVYKDLWPGINLFFVSEPDGVYMEFKVAANMDPNDIRLNLIGHENLVINPMNTDVLVQEGVYLYESLVAEQGNDTISSEFTPFSESTIGFLVGEYDNSAELIMNCYLSYEESTP